jgi:hypothetical protein
MAESAAAGVSEVPVPEPGLTPAEIIARAQALIPQIRDQQEEAEKLGHHTIALDREFVTAGFYRMLQPWRFGGYEFDMPTFWKAMLAVSAGDPGTGPVHFGQQLDADDRACAGHGAAWQPAVLRPDLRRLPRRAGDPGDRRGPGGAG